MSYVVIQGKPLAGTPSLMRSMRDGEGPTFPWAYGGAFREYQQGGGYVSAQPRAPFPDLSGFRTRRAGLGFTNVGDEGYGLLGGKLDSGDLWIYGTAAAMLFAVGLVGISIYKAAGK